MVLQAARSVAGEKKRKEERRADGTRGDDKKKKKIWNQGKNQGKP